MFETEEICGELVIWQGHPGFTDGSVNICELPAGHDQPTIHRDGDVTWTSNSFVDFDSFCEEHDVTSEEAPSAFAAYLNSVTGWDGTVEELDA